jgi:hypothetical protein
MFLAGRRQHHTSATSMDLQGTSSKQACSQGLPADMLRQVLQRVDCKKRLSCCAQVAQAWHTASAAATTDINLVCKRGSIASLAEWLQKHGSRFVSSITLQVPVVWPDYGAVTLWLPFRRLQHLHSLSIVGGTSARDRPNVRLQCANSQHPNGGNSSSGRTSSDDGDSDNSYPNSNDEERWWYGSRQRGYFNRPQKVNDFKHVASTLTSLKLHSVELEGFCGGWGCLTALTALQHLDLQHAPLADPSRSDIYSYHHIMDGNRQLSEGEQLGGVLGKLTSITHLRLQWQMEDKMKEALGWLYQLQELQLYPLQGDRPYTRAPSAGDDELDTPLRLPLALTRLEVHLCMDINSSSTPDLASLTALQHLQLTNTSTLDASLLSGLAQLTHLHISVRHCDKFSSEHMVALLGVLPLMQQLQHLSLEFFDSRFNTSRPAVPVELCSALLSSSSLVSLHLSGVQLPSGCGTRLFGQAMPQLKKINSLRKRYKPFEAKGAEAISPHGDLNSLVANCPNLMELNLAGAVQQGVDLSGLQHLKYLTALVVGGECMDDSCAEGLAKLSGLKQLTVMQPRYNRTRWLGQAPGGGSSDGDAGDSADADGRSMYDDDAATGCQFTFEGLRSLMQLTSLTKFTIDPYCCLFETHYRGSDDGYNDPSTREFTAPVSTLPQLCLDMQICGSELASRNLLHCFSQCNSAILRQGPISPHHKVHSDICANCCHFSTAVCYLSVCCCVYCLACCFLCCRPLG